ncbi:hypothetical protein [Weissella sp. MSCH1]|uniref:hypothetical protein n=1 Tax=Weissella sp. MSCH1 TaxID=3383343 RepID=UPI003896C17D
MINRKQQTRLRAVVAFLSLAMLGSAGAMGYEIVTNQPAQLIQADATTKTVLSLGIPKAVIQTMLDNSLMSDGKTPTAAGKTVTNFTVGDIQKLKTLSLATRVKNADGTYTSKTNAAVADWLGGLDYGSTNGGGSPVVTADVVLGADYLSTGQTTASSILDNGVPKWSGGDQYYSPTPILNVLMAVINSATSATTLDLTGMLSKVPAQSNYNTVHMATLALVQTNKLTALKTLNLGGNQLGVDKQGSAAVDGSAYYLFRSNTLTSGSVTDLDLSNNDFTTLDGNILSGIGSQISSLNLGGNNITSIDYNNGSVFSNASKSDGGSVNLAGSENLDVSGNTAYVIASALNSGGASLTLDDKTANDLAANQIANQSAWPGVSSSGFQSIAPQLTGDTVSNIVDKNATAVTSNVLETLATTNADAINANTLTSLADKNANAITSDALSSIAANNADAIDDKVVSSVLAKKPEAITSDSLSAIAQNSSGALNSDVVSSILEKQPAAITSDSLTAIASNSGDALSSAVVAQVIASNPSAITSDSLTAIAKGNGDALTGDVLKQVAEKNPDAITSDSLAVVAANNAGALDSETLANIAKTNPDAVDAKVLATVASQDASVLTPDLVKQLADSGALDADALKTIAVHNPDALTNLSDDDKQKVVEAAGGADKVGDIVADPTSVPKSEATKPATQEETDTPDHASQAGSVAVSGGNIDFGHANLGTTKTLTSPTAIEVSGTVPKSWSLAVSAMPWQTADGQHKFEPTLTFDTVQDKTNNKALEAIKLSTDGRAKVLVSNASDAQAFDVQMGSIKMTDFEQALAGQAYTGTINWQLSNTQSATQQ